MKMFSFRGKRWKWFDSWLVYVQNATFRIFLADEWVKLLSSMNMKGLEWIKATTGSFLVHTKRGSLWIVDWRKVELTNKLSNCCLFLVDMPLLLISRHVFVGLWVIWGAVNNSRTDRLDPNVLVFWALYFQLIHLGISWIRRDDVNASRIWWSGFLSNEKLLERHNASLNENEYRNESYEVRAAYGVLPYFPD